MFYLKRSSYNTLKCPVPIIIIYPIAGQQFTRGTPLPFGDFLSIGKVIELLTGGVKEDTPTLDIIPKGYKNNVYYLVKDEKTRQERKLNEKEYLVTTWEPGRKRT